MKDRLDKRRHRRLQLHFDLSCRKIGLTAGNLYDGRAQNISSGGIYFETAVKAFERGDLLEVILKIPPTTGLLEFGGKLMGYADVVRSKKIRANRSGIDPTDDKYGVAVQFRRLPKLCM